MTTGQNPYAPPAAELEAPPAGEPGLEREGKLVRLRTGTPFPDRCLRCNAPAERYRMERTVYWRPRWWLWTVWLTLALLFVLSGLAVFLAGIFLLAIVGFVLADLFVRRRLVIDFGLCRRHRRVRLRVLGAFAATWVLVLAFSAAVASGSAEMQPWPFLLLALAMLALAIAASLLYRVQLVRFTEDHVWLQGAGRPFYEALPAAGRQA